MSERIPVSRQDPNPTSPPVDLTSCRLGEKVAITGLQRHIQDHNFLSMIYRRAMIAIGITDPNAYADVIVSENDILGLFD